MVRNVVFDFYGVIFEQGHINKEILIPILQSPKSSSYIRKIYQQYNIGSISRKDFWHRLGVNNIDNIEQKFFSKHKIDKNFKVISNNFKKKKIRLYGLSNIPKEWAIYLKNKYSLRDIFIEDVLSWETKSRKPFLLNYQILMQRFNLKAEETLFVDDKIDNIRAGKRVGMQTCWFNRYNLDKKPYSADYIIYSLKELIPLVYAKKI